MAPNYHNANANSPYGSGDPYYNESSGYITPMPMKKRTSNWIKFGVPVLIAVIIGVVVGAVVGTKDHHSSTSSKSAAANSDGSNSPDDASPSGQAAAASSAAALKNAIGVLPTGTDSLYLLPLYPSTTNSAAFTSPTFHPTTNTSLAWPADPFQPSNPQPTSVRPDRPRLLAPSYKWQVLPQLIANDPYLAQWNNTIFGNASDYYSLPPVQYFMDGSNGILDNSRAVKERIKAFSYVYRMTNDTKWVDRAWTELSNAAGSNFGPDNSTKWNPSHFLDTGEMTAAFAIGYDWLYDQWTSDQKSTLMSAMIQYGLSQGLHAYQNADSGDFSGWWANDIQGNWNCVSNSGMTMGALALLGDDTSGTSEQVLAQSIPNVMPNCVQAVTTDGTWTETPHYWYFGTTGWAEMASSLLTATGSHYGMLTNNTNLPLTGQFHMHTTGPGSIYSWGDHGPNTFSTTANGAMFFMGDFLKHPEWILFQRDQFDAAEPNSMFWYDPTVAGAFWDGMPLDHFFDDPLDQWGAMRSSWTDENALYVAIKAGKLQGHQTHNDLDCGDFVLDAMGTRWAGELGSANYNSPGYFSSDDQESERWLYYRKRSEGQNTILVNSLNQNVNAAPTVQHGTTGEAQGSSTVYEVPSSSTAYWVADLTSAYNDTTSFSRGIRTLNARKQVLLQDEITASQPIMWRMHTNATVSVSSSGTSATLTIGSETLNMQVLSPTSGVTITTMNATRLPTDPPLPAGGSDMPNDGVTVVVINLDPGTYNLQILFNPQWPGMSASDFVTPPNVALANWSLTSHNSS